MTTWCPLFNETVPLQDIEEDDADTQRDADAYVSHIVEHYRIRDQIKLNKASARSRMQATRVARLRSEQEL